MKSSIKREFSHWAINTTVRCQHRCVYCFEGPRAGLKDVPLEETKGLLKRAAKEVPAVIFMGAEPTLNPALRELIAYAARLGLRPNISTNAVRLADRGFLGTLHDAGLHTIELSFPYPDADAYARVTRAKPEGFDRLLRALDNIRELNAGLPAARKHPIHVNLVVSRFNFDRLDRIVGLLKARLSPEEFVLTVKRVTMADAIGEGIFRRRANVPLAALRRVLPPLPAPAGVSLGFRDFPLCALPGREKLDSDLGYLLNGVDVRNNFFTQDRMVDMYPQARRREAHRFDWICEGCLLDPLCLNRGLFYKAESDPEHTPRPVLSPPADVLDWARALPLGKAIAGAARPLTLLGWALREISLRAPPGRRLADSQVSWEPLERGVILLIRGGSAAKFRLAALRGALPLSLAPLDPPVLAPWAAPGAAALEVLLRSLPTPPGGLAPESAGNFLPPEPAPPPPPGWDARIAEGFLKNFAAAQEAPGRGGLRAELLGESVFQVGGPEADEGGCIVIRPARGPGALGFLCGSLRLSASRPGAPDKAIPWLTAACEACLALACDMSRAPAAKKDFLGRAWSIFGKTLWPRSGSAGSLVSGWVGTDEIRLGFTTPRGRDFQLVLAPAGRMTRPFICRLGIGLEYRPCDGKKPEDDIRRIAAAYSRILSSKGSIQCA